MSHLYLSSQRGHLSMSGQPCEELHGVVWTQVIEGLAQHLPTLSRFRARKRLAVRLSGALARPFIVEAAQGLQDRLEVVRYAAAVAPEATGLDGPCTVWCAPWTKGQSRLMGVAAPLELVEAVLQLERQHNIHVTTVQPWWNTALTAHLKRQKDVSRWLVTQELDATTLLGPQNSNWQVVRTIMPPASSEALVTVVRRLAAAEGYVEGEVDVAIHRPTKPDEDVAVPAEVQWGLATV